MAKKKVTNIESEKITAAIYCRVSTYEQAQGEFSSLDAQESILTDYCKTKGWEVYKIYRDTKSGKSLNRDEIQNLLNDAEDGKFDVILATKLDRLSRSLRDFFELDDRLIKLGIDMVITSQNIDTTTSAGKMQRNMMLIFAEFEREVIGERTREKLYSQAQKGYWGGGHTPLGYDAIQKKLVLNDEEAKIVRRIFNLYQEGKSSLEIAEMLNREGYKTKERKSKSKVVSNLYNKDSVLRVLRNKTYIGKITLTAKKLNGKMLTTPIEEEFKGLHDPIIDSKLFDLVNAQLDKAKTNKFSEYKNSPLLLLQKMICGFCGSAMTTTFTTKSQDKRIYGYKCSTKNKKGSAHCECKDAPAKALEEFLIQLMIEIGSTKEIIELVYEQVQMNDDSAIQAKKTHLAELKRNLSSVSTEAKNCIKLFAKNEEFGEIETVKEILTEFEDKKKSITIEITALEKEIIDLSEKGESREAMEDLLTKVPNLLKTLGKEGQRQLISFLVNEIKWKVRSGEKEGEIEISFRGDGRINKKWVNNVNPSDLVSSFSLDWLREQDSNLQPFG